MKEITMIYQFRRDKFVILSTVVAFVIFGGMFLYIALFGQAPMWGLIAIGVLLLLPSASGLRTPRYTYIDEGLIIVKYWLGRKVLADAISVRRITKDDLSGSFRLMGNNGFFGYTGWHYSKAMGLYYLIAVNMDELALVTLANGRKYVINYPSELLGKNDTYCSEVMIIN